MAGFPPSFRRSLPVFAAGFGADELQHKAVVNRVRTRL
jgi:hypothetical protein